MGKYVDGPLDYEREETTKHVLQVFKTQKHFNYNKSIHKHGQNMKRKILIAMYF